MARITRGLNEAGIPCLSAADPDRNPHRTAAAWTLGTVTTILGNPRYTGRQVWNRQRTDSELADPANTSLGHKSVQRWNLPDGWVISDRPAHPALVSEADLIAAQNISAARGPAPVIARRAATRISPRDLRLVRGITDDIDQSNAVGPERAGTRSEPPVPLLLLLLLLRTCGAKPMIATTCSPSSSTLSGPMSLCTSCRGSAPRAA